MRSTRWLACVALLTAACAATSAPPASSPRPFPAFEPPALDATRRAAFGAIVPELDKAFADDQRASGSPGMAVAIVLRGEIVYAKGFGLRDIERNLPFGADTPFPIASVTKGFTAMAILALRDRGLIDLDAPAARYYPPIGKLAAPTRDAAAVTVRDLLNHASGMPEDNPYADVSVSPTEQDLARLLDGGVMTNPPGIHFEYSNVGWAVLGRILERAGGASARELISTSVTAPLGMKSTHWSPKDFPAGTVATGYRGKDNAKEIAAPREIAPIEPPGVMDTAGGLITTARDLARYVSFQVSAWPPRDDTERGPLRRSSVREMQQGMRSFNFDEFLPVMVRRGWPPPLAAQGNGEVFLNAPAYGFGLITEPICEGEPQVEHGGGLPGFGTDMTMLPKEGFGVVVFVNDQRANSSATTTAIRVLRENGLLTPIEVVPFPALASAPAQIDGLLAHWGETAARAIFEPSYFRYQTVAALAERFAKLARAHGACHRDGAPRFVNRLRGSWHEACERGSITFAVAVAPGPRPRLQGIELREDAPPGAVLDRAGASVIDLLAHWDPAAATALLAKASDAPGIELALARLAVMHGKCKMDRAVESDGKEHATFLLACSERPLELSIAIDATGRVTSVSGAVPRSALRPWCAN